MNDWFEYQEREADIARRQERWDRFDRFSPPSDETVRAVVARQTQKTRRRPLERAGVGSDVTPEN